MGKGANINVHIGAETGQLKKKLAEAQLSLKGFKNAAFKMVGGLGLIMGGQALLSGIGSAISKIADFEEQMDKVAAVSRATTKEVKELKDNALELGASTRFTATEIGGMQEVMARLGKTTSEIIGATKAVSQLSIATATELAPAAELMTKTMNAFNLTSSESARVANILSEATSHTALNMEDLGVGLSYAGSSGRAFGWELEKVTAALGILQDNGIDASKAGTGLRRIFIELAKTGLTYEEAMKQIEGSENKLKAAFDLFGKTAANQAVILSENQTKLQDLTDTFGDANQEMTEMVRIMEDNLNNDLKLLSSAWDGLIQKGSVLNNTGRGFVGWLTDAINVMGGNTPAHKKMELLAEAAKHFGVELTALQKTDFRTGLGEGSRFGQELVNKYNEALKVGKALDEFEKSMANDAKAENDEASRVAAAKALSKSLEEAFTPDKVQGIRLYTDEAVRLERVLQGTSLKQAEVSQTLINSVAPADIAAAAFARLKEEVKGVNVESQNAANGLLYIGDVAMDLSGTIESNLESALIGLSQAMGQASVGTASFGDAFLKVVGGFLQQIGAAFITAGITIQEIKDKLMKNPWTAVIGGALMVATGAALSASVSSSAKNMGGRGGSSSGFSSSTNSQGMSGLTNEEPVKLEGEFIIRGNDLVSVINNQNYRNSRTGGRKVGG